MEQRPNDNLQAIISLANWSAAEFSQYSSSQVRHIAETVSKAAAEKSAFYAEWAVRETGFGNVPDKTLKNQVNVTAQLEQFDFDKYCGVTVDHEKQILNVAKPAGVVVALIPSTNPVATVYYKVLSALLTRNAVILCPHPGAKECCVHAADFLAEVAEKAGAPKGAIQTLRTPSVAKVGQLMESEDIDLILATGGPGMVRAAYSSGNPALGVGPGNVAAYVDQSANLDLAAQSLITSKSFDNSLLCTCESVVIAHESIGDALAMKMHQIGGYHVAGAELDKLRNYLYPQGKLNPKAIGKDAQFIAREAGFSVPPSVKVLGVEIFRIAADEPFSKEKMFPVLAMIKVSNFDQALLTANAMLRLQGRGHSAVIHANDEQMISRWGIELPVCRITVNGPGVFGASGFATNLTPSPVIGTGFFGRSSISDNVGGKDLVQWTKVAWNRELTADTRNLEQQAKAIVSQTLNHELMATGATGLGPSGQAVHQKVPTQFASPQRSDNDLQSLIKQLVQEELKSILEAKR
ncbi:aldehyde dehydrogenase family protein [Vibrio sp. SCSIO 43136]|uniref:aldehyde dehydrogenase family protein n=1 Tax=Vibrio sp. SCSIO 43136 TaxID=2819101 RepID=UPI002074EA7F|nr:aldehyde dehydrogenase family protein [Vibrio sp. SCSIO 43136]USD66220.1 aldehyde dehydrogenase family protein [Vibrio sp. SCSIO 43136]